jgi:hypothetical protein
MSKERGDHNAMMDACEPRGRLAAQEVWHDRDCPSGRRTKLFDCVGSTSSL